MNAITRDLRRQGGASRAWGGGRRGVDGKARQEFASAGSSDDVEFDPVKVFRNTRCDYL